MGPSELDRTPVSRPAETAAAGGRRQGGRIHEPGRVLGQVLSELSGRFRRVIHRFVGFTSVARPPRVLREPNHGFCARPRRGPVPPLASDRDLLGAKVG